MYVKTQTAAVAAGQYSDQRRYPRHFLSAPVSTWHLLNSGPQVSRGLTLEIGIGGLAAVLCGAPQVGERVSVRLNLVNINFEALAIVRYSSPARTGFEFLEPSPALLRSIEGCIQGSRLCPCPEPYSVQFA
jgi:hypothetical protein